MAFGFLKKIGGGIVKGLKGGAKFIGGAAKKAAPIVGLIPGVGTVAGGLIGAGGSLLSDVGSGRRISLGQALKSGATGALSGLAGAKLLGGKGLPGLLSRAKGFLGGGGAPRTDTGVSPSVVDEAGNVIRAAGGGGVGTAGGGGGILGRIKDFITSNPARAASLGIAGAGLISGARREGEADSLLKAARARLAEPEAEDLSGLFAGSGNPYASAGSGRSRRAALMALRGG